MKMEFKGRSRSMNALVHINSLVPAGARSHAVLLRGIQSATPRNQALHATTQRYG